MVVRLDGSGSAFPREESHRIQESPLRDIFSHRVNHSRFPESIFEMAIIAAMGVTVVDVVDALQTDGAERVKVAKKIGQTCTEIGLC